MNHLTRLFHEEELTPVSDIFNGLPKREEERVLEDQVRYYASRCEELEAINRQSHRVSGWCVVAALFVGLFVGIVVDATALAAAGLSIMFAICVAAHWGVLTIIQRQHDIPFAIALFAAWCRDQWRRRYDR